MSVTVQLPPLQQFPPVDTYGRTEEVMEFCNNYITTHFPFDSATDAQRYIKQAMPALTCKMIPLAINHERMCIAALLTAFYFILDDYLDNEVMELDKSAVSALLPSPIHDTVYKPKSDAGKMSLFDISADLNGRLGVDMPDAEYTRLVRFMEDYFRAQKKAPGYNSLEELLELRVIEFGAYVLYSYICYTMELSVTDDELADPIVQRCQTLCAEGCLLRNELASYAKEVREGSAQNNVITKIQEWLDCSEEDATKHVELMLTQREAELHATCTEALSATHLSADMKRFIMAIPYVIGGNTWWHHNSSRYRQGRGNTADH